MTSDDQLPGQLELYPDLPAPAGRTGPVHPGQVEATAYGMPRPQGSMDAQRIRGGPRAGQLAVFHQNHTTLLPWRDSVIYALRAAHCGDPFTGPVGVLVVFTMKRPVSLPKRRHSYPAKKPDLDKLLRGVLDAATYAGVWRDDSQVVEATARKHYTADGLADVLKTPGAFIRVWPMPEVVL
jgi:crossover junction endodeoxyribonuclease RusA